MEREEGFYWLRKGDWAVGQWTGRDWFGITGWHDAFYSDSDFDEIGPKIDMPGAELYPPPLTESKSSVLVVAWDNEMHSFVARTTSLWQMRKERLEIEGQPIGGGANMIATLGSVIDGLREMQAGLRKAVDMTAPTE